MATFGFRGEALNALANLAKVSIITRAEGEIPMRLAFNIEGSIVEEKKAARKVGTTVIVENLFHSLPVRRQELEHNIKSQFEKVVKVVQTFALNRPYVKFTFSNVQDG